MGVTPLSLGGCGVLIAVSVAAQEVGAGLTGRVTDPSGTGLAGAAVTARDVDRGTQWPATTNDDGIYAYPRLPNGSYTLKVEAAGFKTFVQAPIVLQGNERGRVDVALELGPVSESVEVISEAPLLQTEVAQVGVAVTGKTLEDAPLVSRNVMELALLMPGVTAVDPSTFTTGTRADASGGRPFVNGNREQSNNFLLDGVDNNQLSDNLSSYQPNPDALQEMRVITSNAPAEFGNFQGGVVSLVMRSGTNQLHGSLFEQFRNDKLNANSWNRNWAGVKRPSMRWNQFGGTLGGRIRRDRLFFFVNYQGLRRATPTTITTATVFPVAWRNGDFSSLLPSSGRRVQLYNPFAMKANGRRDPFPNNQIPVSLYDPAVRKLFADTRVLPQPTVEGVTENLRYATRNGTNSDQGDVKLDWRPGSRDYLTVRFSQGEQASGGFSSYLLAFPSFRSAPVKHGVVNWTRSVGPRIVNEFRAGVNHNRVESGYSNNDIGNYAEELGIKNAGAGLPALRGFAYVSQIGGTNNGLDRLFGTNVYHLLDNVTVIRGRHMMKAGGQILRQQVNAFYAGNNGRSGYISFSGRFTAANAYNPTGTLVGEADFVLGLPTELGRGLNSGTWGHRSTVYGIYFQDDWRVGNELTLNLGLRWEYHSPWVEVADRQSNFDLYTGEPRLAGRDGNSRALYQAFHKDFQPRVGFAYSPEALGKRVVVRGAYTVSSYLEGTGTNLRLPLNPPLNSEFQALYNTPEYALPPTRLSDGLAGIDARDPYVGATLRVWDPFVRPAVSQQWSFAIEHQLPGRTVLTLWYVGQRNTHLMAPKPYLQKQIAGGEVVAGPYLAGNPALLKAISQVSGTASDSNQEYHALQSHVRRRLSGGLTAQAGYTWSKGMTDSIGFYGGGGGQSSGASAYMQNLYDRRADWGPTFFDNKHNLSGLLEYRMPFGRKREFGAQWGRRLDAVLGGWQAASMFTLRTGFPLTPRVSSDPSGTGSRGMRANVIGTPQDPHEVGPDRYYLDITAYAAPGPLTFGSVGIGVVRGPGMKRLDLSLNKEFRVNERMRFQLRGVAYNLTNTPIFQSPYSMVITAPNFGKIRTAQGERNVQVVGRFYF